VGSGGKNDTSVWEGRGEGEGVLGGMNIVYDADGRSEEGEAVWEGGVLCGGFFDVLTTSILI